MSSRWNKEDKDPFIKTTRPNEFYADSNAKNWIWLIAVVVIIGGLYFLLGGGQ